MVVVKKNRKPIVKAAGPQIDNEVTLRDVRAQDLPIFYQQQLDPEATAMAAFPARDRETFNAHWQKILHNEAILKQTILFNGRVAGNIVSFEQDGQRQVGYWLGKGYWGQGIATRALAAFLALERTRPLYAYAVRHNIASRRVLEKCGFTVTGKRSGLSGAHGETIVEIILVLQ